MLTLAWNEFAVYALNSGNSISIFKMCEGTQIQILIIVNVVIIQVDKINFLGDNCSKKET